MISPERIQNLSPKRLALLAMELQSRLEEAEAGAREPIAVVGMSCRFPGDSNSPHAFWQSLCEGNDAIGEVPRDRWDAAAFYDPDPTKPGKISTRWGGFVRDIDQFDPQFFSISPREVDTMDPQQRMLLEVSWEALEHAGEAPSTLKGTRTGVFVGICGNDYFHVINRVKPLSEIDAYWASGNAYSVASGRLAYTLGLEGPAVSIDTACSSSLVAIHLAMQSLRGGECRAALAGGVNLILVPEITMTLSKAGMMAPDGRCKAFDQSANGFVRSEGCGVVVLKKLSDAMAEGNRILAIIRGSATNQDGRSNGLTAPSGRSQEAVIRAALDNASVSPSAVSYVEAHGTGTSLGDPIEALALGSVFGEGRSASAPLRVGSVKTNVGHLEAAAGIAGFIKVVLCLQHQQIPPHLHFRDPSTHIPWDELPLEIGTERSPWTPIDGRRIAGLSSFGFSGTNAHLVLEEAPQHGDQNGASDRPCHVLCLSARNEHGLSELMERFVEQLGHDSDTPFGDACYTANFGRDHFEHRIACIASSTRDACKGLESIRGGKETVEVVGPRKIREKRPRMAFLFTGQGAQYFGMGRQLYESNAVFRSSLKSCDEILRGQLDKPLLSLVFGDESNQHLIHETQYTQPALFAIEYALAQLWKSLGFEPDVVLGHSVGEYVAACVAGVVTLEDGLTLIAQRGRLIQSLPRDGTMAAVFGAESVVVEHLQGFEQQLSIAAVNSPSNVVISGRTATMEQVLASLESAGVSSQRLQVSHAFHSPLLLPVVDDFESVAKRVEFTPPTLELISNLTGDYASDPMNAEYWRRHLMSTVRFAEGIETLVRDGTEMFLEIGPHPTLLGLAQQSITDGTRHWLPSLRRGRGDWEQLLTSLGEFYVEGADIDWSALDRGHVRRRLSLPTYPFQRQRYWVDGAESATDSRERERSRPTSSDWLYQIEWVPSATGPTASHALQGPEQIAECLHGQVSTLSADFGLDDYRELVKGLEALSYSYAVESLSRVGLDFSDPDATTHTGLCVRLGIEDRHQRLVGSLRKMFAEEGVLNEASGQWCFKKVPDPEPSDVILARLRNQYPMFEGELSLLSRCGDNFADALTGRVDPLELLFPGGSVREVEKLTQGSPAAQAYNSLVRETVRVALDKLPSDRQLNVLEVGAGTGGTSASVLSVFPTDRTEYWYTDVSKLFLANARKKFDEYPFLRYERLDIENSPATQGIPENHFDLVIAANVVHATENLGQAMDHVLQLLAPRGLLILLEGVGRQRWVDMTFGLTEGWWKFADDVRTEHPLISSQQWKRLLSGGGYREVVAIEEDRPRSVTDQAVILARKPDAGQAKQNAPPGQWLLLNAAADVDDQLATLLSRRGCSPAQITSGMPVEWNGQQREYDLTENADVDSIFDEITTNGPPLSGVVCFVEESSQQLSDDSPGAMLKTPCQVILNLVRSLASRFDTDFPRLWIVTQDGQPVDHQDELCPWQSAIWGLGRSVAMEHPEFWGGMIDLDHGDGDEVASRIIEDILASDGEDHVAYRSGHRRVARLRRTSAIHETHRPAAFRDNATYLITGGLGGLGLAVARRMVSRGARHLVLMGRSAPNSAASEAIAEMKSDGADVVIQQADVSQQRQLSATLDAISESMPRLGGVVHAAGVLDDGTLMQLDWSQFSRVLAPKVCGSWLLHRMTRDLELDFFVLFSSAASLIGSAGQANHATANAFLDALAFYRRFHGLPAISINWGVWSEVGAAAERGVGARTNAAGMGSFSPEQGLDIFELILNNNPTQIGVTPLDWGTFARTQVSVARRPFFAEPVNDAVKRGDPQLEEKDAELRERLRQTPNDQRAAVLTDYLIARSATIVRVDPDQLDDKTSLIRFGFDSLMAVELKNRVEMDLGVTLPVGRILEGPSIEEISEMLVSMSPEGIDGSPVPASP